MPELHDNDVTARHLAMRQALTRQRTLLPSVQGQSRRCSGIHLLDAYLRRSTQGHTNIGRMCVSDEVEKLISAAVNKTCDLDPAPTWLVKEMRDFYSRS